MRLFQSKPRATPHPTIPKRENFIELNRKFAPLAMEAQRDDAADESYLRNYASWRDQMTWAQLLEKNLAIVLGEPGSGKTWELEQQARRLQQNGEFAFFVKLDEVVRNSFPMAMGDTAYARFLEWKESGRPGWFMLDSVDEAKLQKAEDFDTALKRFREALPNDLEKTHILISSRISEWHPETNGQRVRELFARDGREKKSSEESEDDDESSSSHFEKSKAKLPTVHILPLDRDQVSILAKSVNTRHANDFINGLDAAHAWEFARRPSDVGAMMKFWLENLRIGNLTELIESDIATKLKEPRTHNRSPLSEAKCVEGAEALAAGCVFCKEYGIRFSEDEPGDGGLDGQGCISAAWPQDEYDALLSRPIFDSACYGRVRFHHRRVREFLAARWVRKQMDAGCPYSALEGIFFEKIQGQRVQRASLAPVVAWLCAGNASWNEHVRRWVLESDPAIMLKYGDPHALPISYKRSLLHKLVEAARDRSNLWLHCDDDILKRLADAELEPDIREIIGTPGLADDLRIAMINLAQHGGMKSCIPAALQLVRSEGESSQLKADAVRFVGKTGSHHELDTLLQIVEGLESCQTGLVDALVEVFFPEKVSPKNLMKLFRKTKDERKHQPDISWRITRHIEDRITPENVGQYFEELLALIQTQPTQQMDDDEPGVSKNYEWLKPILEICIKTLLTKTHLTSNECRSLATGLALMGTLKRRADLPEKREEFDALTLKHPEVRSEFFWVAVNRRRAAKKAEITYAGEVFCAYRTPLRENSDDIDWLLEDLKKSVESTDQMVAFQVAYRLHWRSQNPRGSLKKIRSSIQGIEPLQRKYGEFRRSLLFHPVRRRYVRLQDYIRHKRMMGITPLDELKKHYQKIKGKLYLARSLHHVEQGRYHGLLVQLVQFAGENGGSKWVVPNWKNLEQKWGAHAGHAAREGCKKFWRTFEPMLPHEREKGKGIPNGIIVGLNGLEEEWKSRALNFELMPDAEVNLATRYALHELNGFPQWFCELSLRQSVRVSKVLAECIESVWETPEEPATEPDFLNRLCWGKFVIPKQLEDWILEKLDAGDPPSPQILYPILSILLSQPSPALEKLEAIAARRSIEKEMGAGKLAIWFAAYLQINPSDALTRWESTIGNREDADRVMVLTCHNLMNRGFGDQFLLSDRRHYRVESIRRLLPTVYSHVKHCEDIDRTDGGAYTPDARDHAQDFRRHLMNTLAESSEALAGRVIMELAGHPAMAHLRDYLLHLNSSHLKRQADSRRWKPDDIRKFADDNEPSPSTDRDLFRIVMNRLNDIKADVETPDALVIRNQLRLIDPESALRIWLARELHQRSQGKYTPPQEGVIDLNQRPDIRIENPKTAHVSVEIKWAESWSLANLRKALETQLLGQYLRAHNSRHGVLILGLIDPARDHWRSEDGSHLGFPQLVDVLKTQAIELEKRHNGEKRMEVIGIDFRNPTS